MNTQENKEAPTEEPEVKKNTRRVQPAAQQKPKVSAPPPPIEIPATAPPAADPPMQFPTDRDIRVGMDKAKVLAAFGKPSIVTTRIEQDHLVEMYVYLQTELNTATFAQMQDGKVVWAQTTTY